MSSLCRHILSRGNTMEGTASLYLALSERLRVWPALWWIGTGHKGRDHRHARPYQKWTALFARTPVGKAGWIQGTVAPALQSICGQLSLPYSLQWTTFACRYGQTYQIGAIGHTVPAGCRWLWPNAKYYTLDSSLLARHKRLQKTNGVQSLCTSILFRIRGSPHWDIWWVQWA